MSSNFNRFEPPPTLEPQTLRQRLALLLMAFTSCAPALNLTGFMPFWPDMPLWLALFVSVVGGFVGGMMYAPRGTNCLLGVIPGLLAGPGAMLATYFYTYARETIYRVEGAIVWMIGVLPGALLYLVLLKIFYGRPRYRPQPAQAWPPPQPRAGLSAAMPPYQGQPWPQVSEVATDVQPLDEMPPAEVIPEAVIPAPSARRRGGIWWFVGAAAVGGLLWLASRGGQNHQAGNPPRAANQPAQPNAAAPAPSIRESVRTVIDIDDALKGLASGSNAKIRSAAQRLADAQIDEAKRLEVADALAAHLTSRDLFARRAAAAALGRWGLEEHLALLTQRLGDPDAPLRRRAIASLAEHKYLPACETLANMLAAPLDRHYASEALKSFGPAAELAVRKQLEHSDLFVRVEACRILKTIGTQESLAALESATRDSNGLVKLAAQEALAAIQTRQSQN